MAQYKTSGTIQPKDHLDGWMIYPENLPPEEGVYNVLIDTGEVVTASVAYHLPGKPKWTFSRFVEEFHRVAYKKKPRIVAWYPKPKAIDLDRINRAKEDYKRWHN